jgi:hypothetical protein
LVNTKGSEVEAEVVRVGGGARRAFRSRGPTSRHDNELVDLSLLNPHLLRRTGVPERPTANTNGGSLFLLIGALHGTTLADAQAHNQRVQIHNEKPKKSVSAPFFFPTPLSQSGEISDRTLLVRRETPPRPVPHQWKFPCYLLAFPASESSLSV